MNQQLQQLSEKLDGEFYFDKTVRILYATDASSYREMPLAVAIPSSLEDIKNLIQFAHTNKTSLIPRTAGTSLAGQVVGNGIVVDVSKHFNQILEINTTENWVRVQPGVIRDELNLFLKPYGLFFGPETSTANRAMIGGMVPRTTNDNVIIDSYCVQPQSLASVSELDKYTYIYTLCTIMYVKEVTFMRSATLCQSHQ
jgi:FAD/FMN-containing dehydrogenase